MQKSGNLGLPDPRAESRSKLQYRWDRPGFALKSTSNLCLNRLNAKRVSYLEITTVSERSKCKSLRLKSEIGVAANSWYLAFHTFYTWPPHGYNIVIYRYPGSPTVCDFVCRFQGAQLEETWCGMA